jgi:GDPmannose 4,6-dehydratase
MSKIAVITGITGQDGAYLAELLLGKGYRVFGTYRRTSSMNFWRIESLGIRDHKNLELVEFDITDPGNCFSLISTTKPDEVYNLAAQSFVDASFYQPHTTAQITGLGALNMLEAIRYLDTSIRFYQASTSELFGKVQEIPQKETTPFYPRSPYGVAKLYGHWITQNYLESYDIFGCSGILFNHESPLRGIEFVTRKITDAVARIHHGKQQTVSLGNIDAKRDWGYAKDYVDGMYRMLQVDNPDNYVLATGRTESVRTFTTLAFSNIGVDLEWEGQGVDEKGIDKKSGRVMVEVNPRFYRPAEVELLVGDASKAKQELGWEPTTNLEQLCQMMMDSDLDKVARNATF